MSTESEQAQDGLQDEWGYSLIGRRGSPFSYFGYMRRHPEILNKINLSAGFSNYFVLMKALWHNIYKNIGGAVFWRDDASPAVMCVGGEDPLNVPKLPPALGHAVLLTGLEWSRDSYLDEPARIAYVDPADNAESWFDFLTKTTTFGAHQKTPEEKPYTMALTNDQFYNWVRGYWSLWDPTHLIRRDVSGYDTFAFFKAPDDPSVSLPLISSNMASASATDSLNVPGPLSDSVLNKQIK